MPNSSTVATRERIEQLADPIGFLSSVMKGEKVRVALAKDRPSESEVIPTLDQRLTAAAKLADKLVPNAKARSIHLELPSIDSAEGALKAMACIASAVARGEITPDEGQQVAAIVDLQRRCIETADLATRIARLEIATGISK